VSPLEPRWLGRGAGAAEAWGSVDLLQLPLRGNDKVQAPKAHVGAGSEVDVADSHSRPGDGRCDVRRSPTWRARGVPGDRLVNLFLHVGASDGVLRGHKIYTDSGRMSLRLVSCDSCY